MLFVSILSFIALVSALESKTQFPLEIDSNIVFEDPSDVPADFSLDLSEQRLVQWSDHQEPVWITEADKLLLKAQGINFMDITDAQELGFRNIDRIHNKGFPNPKLNESVQDVISELSIDGPVENLQKLTSFRTRYYRSGTGQDSQRWLLGRIDRYTQDIANSERLARAEISVSEFEHSWGQNTIIARINGSSKADEVVIIGAHQDSTNLLPFLPAPGADDDGSGTVTILEAYRALLVCEFKPQRTVEFHWYSAEEGGLLGSQALAKAYEAVGVNVYAMVQMDMTAWVKSGTKEEVGIMNDFVDPELTTFNKKLVEAYLDIPWVDTKCGYACSDHASWMKAGYPASFTVESTMQNSNKNIHSTNDRLDVSPEFSFEHMLEFSKLASAFAVELGEWSKE